jgi:hypothetical protein
LNLCLRNIQDKMYAIEKLCEPLDVGITQVPLT